MTGPLYREQFEASVLLSEHPPSFRHPHKAALFEVAYPDHTALPATIEVTRWMQHVDEPIRLDGQFEAVALPDSFDYVPIVRAAPSMEWHVNFADPSLFFGYGSRLFAQDEMQVAEHPLLASVREALLAKGLDAETIDERGATPILVTQVERRLRISTGTDVAAGRPQGIYGNRFGEASLQTVLRATERIDPPTFTNLIAMAAPVGGPGRYQRSEVGSIFATAVTAFGAARQESTRAFRDTVIHTGFWGCGAFGGNRVLMVALQALAARAADVRCLVLHARDGAGVEQARAGLEIADRLALEIGSSGTSASAIAQFGVDLGLRWGFSDGN